MFLQLHPAYGRSQAKGQIWAAAGAYATAMATPDLNCICDLGRDLNLLSHNGNANANVKWPDGHLE